MNCAVAEMFSRPKKQPSRFKNRKAVLLVLSERYLLE